MLQRTSLVAAILLSSVTYANEDNSPDKKNWTANGELGLVVSRGNSDTDTLNGQFTYTRVSGHWSSEFDLSALRASDSDETTANRFTTSAKLGRIFTEKSYLFSAIRFESDDFAAFENQSTFSVGYGRNLMNSKKHQLKSELGVGGRSSKQADNGQTRNEIILRGSMIYQWKLSESTTLDNNFLIESGSNNSFIDNQLGLSVSINRKLAIKLGLSVRHNTETVAGRDNTDILSTVNLVYNFNG